MNEPLHKRFALELSHKSNTANRHPSDADFIIVGAGSAGCVLAAEISRRQLGSVLLIESGGQPTSRHLKVPIEYPRAFVGHHAWQHRTAPQKGLANRRIPLPAGKTLGGSSAINALIYMRGHVFDFERWHDILGADWNSEDTQAAFRAIEQWMGIFDFSPPELHPAIAEFLSIAERQSPLATKQPLHEPKLGLGPYSRCQNNGRRQSAWDLWLKPLLKRKDRSPIECLTNASVQHLVLDRQRVVGVLVAHSKSHDSATAKSETTIYARKGVIVCAGAILSPSLLLASGIGDREELARVGLECKLESPWVGKNLQDHIIYPVVRGLKRHASLPSQMSNEHRYEYAVHRTGPMSSNIAEAGGFFELPSKKPCRDAVNAGPDFQWHLTPTHYLEYPKRAESTAAISVAVSLCRPSSRGSISLIPTSESNAAERHETAINPNYLSSEDDSHRFLEAVRWTREFLSGNEFNTLLGDELLPGEKRKSDDQIAASMERFATTIYHYAGTCSMGNQSNGVVNSRFQVHGLEGLWVCDASAMPTLVSGNTQATVMMMAYRLANWLQ